MANNESETPRASISGIDWLATFPCAHVFRTFKLAIHPSKLFIALLAVLTCYVGGRFLDLFAGHRVVCSRSTVSARMPADEIQHYLAKTSSTEFWRWRDETRKNNCLEVAAILARYDSKKSTELTNEGEDIGAFLDELHQLLEDKQDDTDKVLKRRHKTTQGLLKVRRDAALDKAKTGAAKDVVERQHDEAMTELKQSYQFLRISVKKSTSVAQLILKLDPTKAIETVVQADDQAEDRAKDQREVQKDRGTLRKTVELADAYEQGESLQDIGVFDAALSYGILMFNCAVDSVLGAELFFNEDFVPNFGGAASGQSMQPGLVATLGYAVRGLGWFVRVHPFYFVIYSLFCLAVWAVAGGAICRIAAVHATQDEKIPIREALRFAQAKFAHFFSAPLLPVLFIIGCCIPLVLAGLVGLIPGLGQLIVGVLFVILLAIGFVLALIIIGALGGLGLMYPTIAVEGSDAFDAFSRSYNYVYARPWRTISYTLITAVYGTLCFVFVKLLAGLIFSATSLIVGVTMNWVGAAYASPFGKLQAMWFQASDGPFFGRFYLFPLSAMEGLGSFFIAFWVFLLVGLVVAFAVSFFFCGYTVIYLLLRQRVDATELDDVFIEELESEAALPGEAGAVPSTEESSVPEQPSAEESAGGQGETS